MTDRQQQIIDRQKQAERAESYLILPQPHYDSPTNQHWWLHPADFSDKPKDEEST